MSTEVELQSNKEKEDSVVLVTRPVEQDSALMPASSLSETKAPPAAKGGGDRTARDSTDDKERAVLLQSARSYSGNGAETSNPSQEKMLSGNTSNPSQEKMLSSDAVESDGLDVSGLVASKSKSPAKGEIAGIDHLSYKNSITSSLPSLPGTKKNSISLPGTPTVMQTATSPSPLVPLVPKPMVPQSALISKDATSANPNPKPKKKFGVKSSAMWEPRGSDMQKAKGSAGPSQHSAYLAMTKWRLWVWLRAVVLAYQIATTPYRASFSREFDYTVILDWIIDVVFFLDFLILINVIKLFWAQLAIKGEVVVEPVTAKTSGKKATSITLKVGPRRASMAPGKRGRLQTMPSEETIGSKIWSGVKRAHPVEIITSFPVDIVLGLLGYWRLCYLCRLPRLLRVRFIFGYLDELAKPLPEDDHKRGDKQEAGESRGASGSIVKTANVLVFVLYKIFFLLITVSHIFACVWIALGNSLNASGDDNWFQTTKNDSLVTDSDWKQYLFSLNFAVIVAAAVGYGDSTPNNVYESVLAASLNLFGFILYAVIIGVLVPIIKETSAAREHFDRRTEMLKTVIRTKNVAADQTEAVAAYYDQLWKQNLGVEETVIMHEHLTKGLKIELLAWVGAEALGSVPFLDGTLDCPRPLGLIRSLLARCKGRMYSSLDTIIARGANEAPLFLLTDGSCDVLGMDEVTVADTLSRNSCFGHEGFLSKGVACPKTVRVTAGFWVSVLTLYPGDFWEVITPFEAFRKLVQSRSKPGSSMTKPGASTRGSINATGGELLQTQGASFRKEKEVALINVWLPSSIRRRLWDALGLCVALYYAYTVPYRAAFWHKNFSDGSMTVEQGLLQLIPDWLCDLYCVADMVVRYKYMAGINSQTKEIITDQKEFGQQYLRTWLPLDLLVVLPLEIGVLFSSNVATGVYWIALLRVNRLFKMLRLYSYGQNIRIVILGSIKKQLAVATKVFNLVLIYASIATFCHTFGCGWYCLAYVQNFLYPDFLDIWTEGCMIGGVTTNNNRAYSRAFYYAIATITTTGYGDCVPDSPFEHAFSCFFILLGTFVFKLVDGFESMQAENASEAHKEWSLKLGAVKKFIQTREISPETVLQIQKYNVYLWNTQQGWSNKDALDTLPEHIKLELMSYLTRHMFLKIPLIQSAGTAFLDRLTLALDLQTFSPGDVIAREKDPMDTMLMILQGDVSAINKKDDLDLGYFGPGQCLGEQALQEIAPAKASIIAVSFTSVALLHAKVFNETIALFPKVAKAVKHERDLLAVKRQWFSTVTTDIKEDDVKNMINAEVEVDSEQLKRNLAKKQELELKRLAAKKSHMLSPLDYRRQILSLLCWIMMMYSCFCTPYRICFINNESFMAQHSWIIIADAVADLVFCLEMYMRVTHYTVLDEGVLLDSPKDIRNKYLRFSEVGLDVCGTMILDWFVLLVPMPASWGLWGASWRVWSVLRLSRMLRLLTRSQEYLEAMHNAILAWGLEIDFTGVQILAFFLEFVLFVHWFACVWYFVSLTEGTEANWNIDDPAVEAPLSISFSDEQWPRYMQSFYYVIITMATIGYGDIKPVTDRETVFGIIVLVFGCVRYVQFLSKLAALASQMAAAESERMQHERSLETYFLKRPDVPVELSSRITAYYRTLWEQFGGLEEDEIMRTWPQPLKEQTAMEIYGKVIRMIPIFDEFTDSFVRRLVSTLRSKLFAAGDYIVTKGHVNHTMYILRPGARAIVESIPQKRIGDDVGVTIIGEQNVLQTHPAKQKHSIRVTSRTCDTVRLSFTSMQDLFGVYPQYRDKFKKLLTQYVVDTELAHAQNPEHRQSQMILLDYPGWMVIPKSKFFVAWRLASLVLLLFTIISFPITLAFFDGSTTFSEAGTVPLLLLNGIVDIFFMVDFYLKIRRWIPTSMWKESKRIPKPSEITADYFSMFSVQVDPKLKWREKTEIWLDSPGVVLAITPIVLLGVGMAITGITTDTPPAWFTALDIASTCFFIIEMVVRIIAYGPKKYFTQFMCAMDFLIVLIDVVALSLEGGGGGGSSAIVDTLKGVKAAKVLRISRLLRLRSKGAGLMVVFADFIGVLPLESLIVLGIVSSGSMTTTTNLTIYRCAKMALVYRIPEYIEAIHIAMDSNRVMKKVGIQFRRAVLYIIVVVMSLHILACFWYFVGTLTGEDNSWFRLKDGHVMKQGVFGKYMDAFGWALATTSSVGYGDFHATNMEEIFYAIFVVMCGAVINAIIIGSVSAHASITSEKQYAYNRKIAVLQSYMISRNVPPRLRTRILLYHQYIHNHDTVLDDFTVIDKLPPEFKKEVNECLYLHLTSTMGDLTNHDGGFLSMLCSRLLPAVYLAGEHFMKVGDYNDTLFFVHHGQVEVTPKVAEHEMPAPRLEFGDGSLLGEVSFFFGRPSCFKILCRSNVQLLMVSKVQFRKLLSNFPYITDRLITNLIVAQGKFMMQFAGYEKEELSLETLRQQFLVDTAAVVSASETPGRAAGKKKKREKRTTKLRNQAGSGTSKLQAPTSSRTNALGF